MIGETGILCFCCGKRNTVRMGHRLYQCQHTGETSMLFVGAKAGAYTLPIRTGLALEEERSRDAGFARAESSAKRPKDKGTLPASP